MCHSSISQSEKHRGALAFAGKSPDLIASNSDEGFEALQNEKGKEMLTTLLVVIE